MKGLKGVLVLVIGSSMVLLSGFKGYVFSQDKETWGEKEQKNMPVYHEGFNKNKDAYRTEKGSEGGLTYEEYLNQQTQSEPELTYEEYLNQQTQSEPDYGDNLPKGIQDKLDETGEVPGNGLHRGWTQGNGYGRTVPSGEIAEPELTYEEYLNNQPVPSGEIAEPELTYEEYLNNQPVPSGEIAEPELTYEEYLNNQPVPSGEIAEPELTYEEYLNNQPVPSGEIAEPELT